jgi:pyruvate,orthophosphate dikinase
VPGYVYDFSEGSKEMKALLGGKGANLAEMTTIGLPVPDGFTITTAACLDFLSNGGTWPDGLKEQVDEHLAALEERVGKRLATPTIRCSCRSGRGRRSRCRA